MRKPWVPNSKSVISLKICPCIHPFFPKYAPVSTPSSYCIGYRAILTTGPSYYPKCTLCIALIIMKNQPSSILNKVCYHVAVKSHKRPGCGHVRMCEVILRLCKSLWGGASSSRTWQIDLKLSDFFVFLVWLKRFFVGERLCDGIPKTNKNIYFGLRMELCARFACKRLNPDNTLLLCIAQANKIFLNCVIIL